MFAAACDDSSVNVCAACGVFSVGECQQCKHAANSVRDSHVIGTLRSVNPVLHSLMCGVHCSVNVVEDQKDANKKHSEFQVFCRNVSMRGFDVAAECSVIGKNDVKKCLLVFKRRYDTGMISGTVMLDEKGRELPVTIKIQKK